MVSHHHLTARATSRAWGTFVVKVIVLNPALTMPFLASPLSLSMSLERRLTRTQTKGLMARSTSPHLLS